MRRLEQDTKELLLDAAELLFGEDGVEATSMRAIAAAAQANLAAANYHYGSKEGLVRATLARRILPLVEERLHLLDAYEAEGGTVPLESLLYAYFAPALDLCRKYPQSLRLAGRMVTEADPELRRIYTAFFEPMTQRFLAALRGSLPEMSEEELLWRWHFVLGVGVHTWTNLRDLEHVSGRACNLDNPAEALERIIVFCAAGFRAPLRGGKKL